MPQFDISTYTTQIFWLVVVFFSFWFVMDKVITPKIMETIEDRKRKYNDLILKAERVNKKAFEALNKYEEKITAAKKNASEEIKKNEIELKEFIEKKEEEIEKNLEEKIKNSQDQIEKEKKEILNHIDELSEVLAFDIVKKIEIKNITIEDIKEIALKRGENE